MGRHSCQVWFPIEMILAFLIHRSLQCFRPSFQSIDFLGQEKKRKIYFKTAATAAILDFRSKRFDWFWSASNLNASYQGSSQLAFRFRTAENWISDRKKFDLFYLKVTLLLAAKFQVSWSFSSREERKNIFSKWWLFWIFDRNNTSFYWSTSHPYVSYQVSSLQAIWCRRKSEK